MPSRRKYACLRVWHRERHLEIPRKSQKEGEILETGEEIQGEHAQNNSTEIFSGIYTILWIFLQFLVMLPCRTLDLTLLG